MSMFACQHRHISTTHPHHAAAAPVSACECLPCICDALAPLCGREVVLPEHAGRQLLRRINDSAVLGGVVVAVVRLHLRHKDTSASKCVSDERGGERGKGEGGRGPTGSTVRKGAGQRAGGHVRGDVRGGGKE